MIGSINCVYETPCGWCSKWDKKCDSKIGEYNKKSNFGISDNASISSISSDESKNNVIWTVRNNV